MTDETDSRPARPAVAAHRPAPDLAPPLPPSPVRTSRLLWIGSFIAGLVVVGIAVLHREAHSEQLTALVEGIAPGRAEETLESVATVVFVAALVALGVVITVQALLLRAMMRHHGSSRMLMLALLPVHVFVAVLADTFLALGPEGIYLRGLLVLQFALAVSGVIAALLPSAAAWFRGADAGRRAGGRQAG